MPLAQGRVSLARQSVVYAAAQVTEPGLTDMPSEYFSEGQIVLLRDSEDMTVAIWIGLDMHGHRAQLGQVQGQHGRAARF